MSIIGNVQDEKCPRGGRQMSKKGKIGSMLLKTTPNRSAATGLFRAGFIPSKPATALQQGEAGFCK